MVGCDCRETLWLLNGRRATVDLRRKHNGKLDKIRLREGEDGGDGDGCVCGSICRAGFANSRSANQPSQPPTAVWLTGTSCCFEYWKIRSTFRIPWGPLVEISSECRGRVKV